MVPQRLPAELKPFQKEDYCLLPREEQCAPEFCSRDLAFGAPGRMWSPAAAAAAAAAARDKEFLDIRDPSSRCRSLAASHEDVFRCVACTGPKPQQHVAPAYATQMPLQDVQAAVSGPDQAARPALLMPMTQAGLDEEMPDTEAGSVATEG